MSFSYEAFHGTGLPWRPVFKQKLSETLPATSFALLIADISGFSIFNLTTSHDAGNRILESLAADVVRIFPGSLVGRYGGDSFVVQVLDKGSAEALAEALRSEFDLKHAELSAESSAKHFGCPVQGAKPFVTGGDEVRAAFTSFGQVLKLAIGIAYSSGPDCDLIRLFEATEAAVLASKVAGSNRTSVAPGEY